MKPACLASVVALAMACGGTSTPPTAPDGTRVAWADMTKAQRATYMETTVLPTMKAKFVAFDAEEFGDMNCKTCHGDAAEDGSFEMPNPGLPELDFANMDKLSEEDRKAAEFMKTVVVPEMAALLGTTPYDPATQAGFGCASCHTMAAPAAE